MNNMYRMYDASDTVNVYLRTAQSWVPSIYESGSLPCFADPGTKWGPSCRLLLALLCARGAWIDASSGCSWSRVWVWLPVVVKWRGERPVVCPKCFAWPRWQAARLVGLHLPSGWVVWPNHRNGTRRNQAPICPHELLWFTPNPSLFNPFIGDFPMAYIAISSWEAPMMFPDPEAESTPGANAYAGNFIRLNCLVSCQGPSCGSLLDVILSCCHCTDE